VSCSVGPVVGGWGADGPEKGGFFPAFSRFFQSWGRREQGKEGENKGKRPPGALVPDRPLRVNRKKRRACSVFPGRGSVEHSPGFPGAL